MNSQQDFSKTLEECMRSLRIDLDMLKFQIGDTEVSKTEFSDNVYQLQEKIDNFEMRIKDMTTASPQLWVEARSLAVKALEEASYSIQLAKQRYLH